MRVKDKYKKNIEIDHTLTYITTVMLRNYFQGGRNIDRVKREEGRKEG